MASSYECWGGSREDEDEKLSLKVIRDESNNKVKLESDKFRLYTYVAIPTKNSKSKKNIMGKIRIRKLKVSVNVLESAWRNICSLNTFRQS